MGNCTGVVQFDMSKRTEEQAVKGATSTAPIYRGLAAKGLIRKDYLNGDAGTGGVYLWGNPRLSRGLVHRRSYSRVDPAFRCQAEAHLVRYPHHGRQSAGRDARQRQDAGGSRAEPPADAMPSADIECYALRIIEATSTDVGFCIPRLLAKR